MTKLKKLSSLALTAAVALFGMALTAGTAQADIITFSVNEAAVPGANPTTVSGANGITAKYEEAVHLTPVTATTGTFSSSIIVLFSQYDFQGVTIPSQLGAPETGRRIDRHESVRAVRAGHGLGNVYERQSHQRRPDHDNGFLSDGRDRAPLRRSLAEQHRQLHGPVRHGPFWRR